MVSHPGFRLQKMNTNMYVGEAETQTDGESPRCLELEGQHVCRWGRIQKDGESPGGIKHECQHVCR